MGKYELSCLEIKVFFIYIAQLAGDLNGKKFGLITEGLLRATAGVKSVIDDVVEKMRRAGAIVDTISLPEHTKSKRT